VARNCSSRRAYVRNLVKWPERECDHKTLYNMEITCGGYNTKPIHDCAEAFKWPQRTHLVRSKDADLKGSVAFVG